MDIHPLLWTSRPHGRVPRSPPRKPGAPARSACRDDGEAVHDLRPVPLALETVLVPDVCPPLPTSPGT
jgi:hypothetical protein